MSKKKLNYHQQLKQEIADLINSTEESSFDLGKELLVIVANRYNPPEGLENAILLVDNSTDNNSTLTSLLISGPIMEYLSIPRINPSSNRFIFNNKIGETIDLDAIPVYQAGNCDLDNLKAIIALGDIVSFVQISLIGDFFELAEKYKQEISIILLRGHFKLDRKQLIEFYNSRQLYVTWIHSLTLGTIKQDKLYNHCWKKLKLDKKDSTLAKLFNFNSKLIHDHKSIFWQLLHTPINYHMVSHHAEKEQIYSHTRLVDDKYIIRGSVRSTNPSSVLEEYSPFIENLKIQIFMDKKIDKYFQTKSYEQLFENLKTSLHLFAHNVDDIKRIGNNQDPSSDLALTLNTESHMRRVFQQLIDKFISSAQAIMKKYCTEYNSQAANSESKLPYITSNVFYESSNTQIAIVIEEKHE